MSMWSFTYRQINRSSNISDSNRSPSSTTVVKCAGKAKTLTSFDTTSANCALTYSGGKFGAQCSTEEFGIGQ